MASAFRLEKRGNAETGSGGHLCQHHIYTLRGASDPTRALTCFTNPDGADTFWLFLYISSVSTRADIRTWR